MFELFALDVRLKIIYPVGIGVTLKRVNRGEYRVICINRWMELLNRYATLKRLF